MNNLNLEIKWLPKKLLNIHMFGQLYKKYKFKKNKTWFRLGPVLQFLLLLCV